MIALRPIFSFFRQRTDIKPIKSAHFVLFLRSKLILIECSAFTALDTSAWQLFLSSCCCRSAPTIVGTITDRSSPRLRGGYSFSGRACWPQQQLQVHIFLHFKQYSIILCIAVDLHGVHKYPDPDFHVDADPDVKKRIRILINKCKSATLAYRPSKALGRAPTAP
jgi:hypothetical protein